MGLLRTGIGTVTGVLSDQWKEYFYCDALGADVLAVKGRKRVSGTGEGEAVGISVGSGEGVISGVGDGSGVGVASGVGVGSGDAVGPTG